jgi:hypothetical protein
MLRASFTATGNDYAVTFSLDPNQFQTGFNAFNLNLYVDPGKGQLLSTASSNVTGEVAAVNNQVQRFEAGKGWSTIPGQVAISSASPNIDLFPTNTPLATLPFRASGSGDFSVQVNGLIVGATTYIQPGYAITFNADEPHVYSLPFNRSAAGLNFNAQNNQWSFTDPDGRPINIASFNRLKFADADIALDVLGANSAGGIFRLYQAALNRTPDQEGLGFWIKWADSGAVNAVTMASRFVWENEFKQMYSVNPRDEYLTGEDIPALVSKIYENVLKRPPDLSGLNFYSKSILGHFDDTVKERKTVGQVLAEISDSPENFQLTLVGVQNGIQYREFLGEFPSL